MSNFRSLAHSYQKIIWECKTSRETNVKYRGKKIPQKRRNLKNTYNKKVSIPTINVTSTKMLSLSNS